MVIRILGVMAVTSLSTWLAAQQPEAAPGARPPVVARPAGTIDGFQTNGRWREGTKFSNVTGKFQQVGDRLQFLPADGKQALNVLENLMAERVGKALTDANSINWQIHAVVTEFNKGNYLLLQSATVIERNTTSVEKSDR